MEPTFKKFQSNGCSGETIKFCLDFLCNTPLCNYANIMESVYVQCTSLYVILYVGIKYNVYILSATLNVIWWENMV